MKKGLDLILFFKLVKMEAYITLYQEEFFNKINKFRIIKNVNYLIDCNNNNNAISVIRTRKEASNYASCMPCKFNYIRVN